MPEVTGWSPVATIPRMQLHVSVNPSPDLNQGWRGRVGASPEGGCTIANSPEEFHDSAAISATTCRRRGLRSSSGLRLRLHCAKCNVGLMAILLGLGVMDLRAMAVVGAAITVERLAPIGERVARATGAVVVVAGLFLIVRAAA